LSNNKSKLPPHQSAKYLEQILGENANLKMQLKEMEHRLDVFASGTPTYICEIDSHGHILFVNRTYEGVKSSQVVGSNLINWFPKEQQATVGSLIKEAILDKKIQKFSYTIPDPKENLRSYAAEIIPFQRAGQKTLNAFYLATDITDQKQTKKELKEKDYYLNQAQTIAKLGHWRLNPETEQVKGSDELFRLFQLSKSQSTLKDFAKIVHPDDREMDLNHIKQGIENGIPWNLKHRLQFDDGSQKWVRAKGEAVFDKNGKVIELIGTVQDITRQALSEKKLRESENRFKSLAHYTPNIVFTIDPEGTILYMNHPPDGIDINEVIGKSMFTHIESKFHDDIKKFIKSVFEHGQSFQYECRGIGPFKKTSDYLSNIGPVFGHSDNVISAIISTQDITEKKKIQHLLVETEEGYKLLIETIVHGVQEVDLSGKIISANSAYHHMLGYENQELIGTSMYQILPGKKAKKKLNDYITFLIEEQPEPAPWFDRVAKNNGDSIEVQTDWNYVRDRKGELIGFVSIISDISERKKMEDDLKKSHESLELKIKERTSTLEEMNTALSVLLRKRNNDKKETEMKIISHYKSLVLPFVEKLKNSLTLEDQRNLMMILESNLKEFLEPFSQKLSDPLVNLTPVEIQIANMVKQGMSNKEIAKTLNNSIRTITNHRQHIRTKLKIRRVPFERISSDLLAPFDNL